MERDVTERQPTPIFNQQKTFDIQRRIARSAEFNAMRPTTRLLWYDLWHYQAMNDEGHIWPSRSTLAANLQVAVSAVARGLDELKSLGLLHPIGRTGKGGRETVIYILTLPKWLHFEDTRGPHMRTPPVLTRAPHRSSGEDTTGPHMRTQEDLMNGSIEREEQPSPPAPVARAAKKVKYDHPLYKAMLEVWYRDWERRMGEKPEVVAKTRAAAFRVAKLFGNAAEERARAEMQKVLDVAWTREHFPFNESFPTLELVAARWNHLRPLVINGGRVEPQGPRIVPIRE